MGNEYEKHNDVESDNGIKRSNKNKSVKERKSRLIKISTTLLVAAVLIIITVILWTSKETSRTEKGSGITYGIDALVGKPMLEEPEPETISTEGPEEGNSNSSGH